MNSTTGDFSEIRRSVLREEIYNRGAHSSVKKKPQKLLALRPLNLIGIKKEIEEDLKIDEKEIASEKEQGHEKLTTIQEDDIKLQQIPDDIFLKDVTNHSALQSVIPLRGNNEKCLIEKAGYTFCPDSRGRSIRKVKENINIPQEQRNDSFDMDFSALSLLTPVKQSDNNVSHTSSIFKSEPARDHFQQFITPKVNTSLSKNRCSLSKKSLLVTPLNPYNNVLARALVTPCKPDKISPTLPENRLDHTNEDKRNSNTFPNYPKDKTDTPSHKIPMKFIHSDHSSTNEENLYANVTKSLRDDTFRKIKVNNVEYIMFSLIGKGGSSKVYECYNLESKLHVAIKCVSLENAASASGYINEVKLLQQLQHCDKIIKMYDYEVSETQKQLLVVLENGGKDLSTILKHLAGQKSHIPMYMLLFYWMEMLYAVRQIHSNGIIHSDLKPANFLKVDEGLKLIDFGIASSVQTDMTSVIKTKQEGSCNYISPEALNSDCTNFNNTSTEKYKIHFKSDVWSLGCILYQFVYRRTPFQHITQLWPKLAAIMNPQHKIDYPDVDWVSPKIICTIKQCLQYNVKSRPSVDELIAEYNSILHNI